MIRANPFLKVYVAEKASANPVISTHRCPLSPTQGISMLKFGNPFSAMSARSICRGWVASATLVTVLALVLRVVAISRYGFDHDEVFSLHAVNSTWTHLLSVAANDKSHPPLFYTVLKLWLGLGPADESWVRALSVIFGVALVPVAAAICSPLRLSTTDTALVLILTSINGLLIYFSQHARMFALLELSAIVSLLCFINLLRTPRSFLSLYLLTVVNIIMVYSHYWGWFFILSELLITIAGYRVMLAKILVSVSIVAVSFLPWAVAVGTAALRQGGLSQQIAWMGSDVGGPTSYAWLFASLNGVIDFNHSTTLGIVLFMAPICIFAINQVKLKDNSIWDPRSPFFWITIIATPLVMTSVAGYVTKQNLWNVAHLSIVAVPYFMLIGLSIASLRSSFVRVAFRCGLLSWAFVASSASLAEADKKLHWEKIANEIATRDPAPIYTTEEFITLPLEFQLERLADPVAGVNANPNLAEITDRRFWFVYRNTTWHGQPPLDQLHALHDIIDDQVSTRSGKQEITALLVEKESVGASGVYSPSDDRKAKTSPNTANVP
jgi:hypothetical protein